MNPKEVFYSTAYSVQLPYIACHSLKKDFFKQCKDFQIIFVLIYAKTWWTIQKHFLGAVVSRAEGDKDDDDDYTIEDFDDFD